MGFLLILTAFFALGLCLAEDKTQRRRFLGGVAALVYFPIAVLLCDSLQIIRIKFNNKNYATPRVTNVLQTRLNLNKNLKKSDFFR